MALILRQVKGSPLTYQEMDDNLTFLNGGGAIGFSDVLANSNTTGGYTMAFLDGTNWIRVQDRAIVS